MNLCFLPIGRKQRFISEHGGKPFLGGSRIYNQKISKYLIINWYLMIPACVVWCQFNLLRGNCFHLIVVNGEQQENVWETGVQMNVVLSKVVTCSKYGWFTYNYIKFAILWSMQCTCNWFLPLDYFSFSSDLQWEIQQISSEKLFNKEMNCWLPSFMFKTQILGRD